MSKRRKVTIKAYCRLTVFAKLDKDNNIIDVEEVDELGEIIDVEELVNIIY